MAQSRCALTVKRNGSDVEDASSRASLYFDSLASEPVLEILCRISDDSKIQLLYCHGWLGEAVPHSVKSLSADVIEGIQVQYGEYAYYELEEDNNDGGLRNLKSVEEETNVVVAWKRHFFPDSTRLIAMCRCLRSLSLDFSRMNHSDLAPFDLLFAACGTVLEELKLLHVRDISVRGITLLISRRCSALNSLSLHGVVLGTSCLLPLFGAVGACLRKFSLLTFGMNSYVELAQWCPVLEDVEIHGRHISFVLELNSPLQVVRFASLPNVDELIKLVEKRPNIAIHLPGLFYTGYTREILRVSGRQVQYLMLNCNGAFEESDDSEIIGSLVKLEELNIVGLGRHQFFFNKFLDAFFTTSKPELRKLTLTGVNHSTLFDYLASRTSNLEEFTCLYYGNTCISDTEMSRFLFTNKRLRQVFINYRVQLVESTNFKSSPASIRRTAWLIRSLKYFPSLRHLKVDVSSGCNVYGQHQKIIADACVALRRRELRVEVGNVVYLE